MKNPRKRADPQEPDLRRAERLVMELMAIPGASGREAQVADYVCRALQQAGVPHQTLRFDTAHRRTPLKGEVGNLVLRLPGSVRSARRMLSAHLDTVPICVGCRPLRQGRTVRSAVRNTGLGADDRAGCAVILNTAIELLSRGQPHPPLTFCWFIQEEIGLQGSRTATRALWGQPKLAFNWDGGAPHKMTIGATGGCRMTIQIEGKASHAGGAPEEGISAIAIASLAIADLHSRGWHGDVHQNGHRGTSNVGVIQGGAATNVVADRVTLLAEARSHDPRFRQRILDEFHRAFQRATQSGRNIGQQTGQERIDTRVDYESFLIPLDSACVQLARRAIQQIGREPEPAISNGGVDANWITAHGIPTVTLGCGQRDQHMVTEELDLDDFQDACRIAWRLATDANEVTA
jgi:tripeptide aminopeptidase